MKKFLVGIFSALAAVSVFAASNIYTDFWTINGSGSLRNTAIAWIDSARDFFLYDGDLYLGGKGATPSTTAGEYPAIKVPIKNDNGSSWAQGDLIVIDPDCVGCGKVGGATTDLTTWIGIAEGTVANGSVGYVITEGYAIAKTTGTVNRGDTLVSTTSAAGYLTGDSTPTTGADVGVAIASGTAAGGTTLIFVR